MSIFQTLIPSSKAFWTLVALITLIITTFDQNCVQLFFTSPKRILFNCCIWRDNYFKLIATKKNIFWKTLNLKCNEKLQIDARWECMILESQKTWEYCFNGFNFIKSLISYIFKRIELKQFEIWSKTHWLNVFNKWHEDLF